MTIITITPVIVLPNSAISLCERQVKKQGTDNQFENHIIPHLLYIVFIKIYQMKKFFAIKIQYMSHMISHFSQSSNGRETVIISSTSSRSDKQLPNKSNIFLRTIQSQTFIVKKQVKAPEVQICNRLKGKPYIVGIKSLKKDEIVMQFYKYTLEKFLKQRWQEIDDAMRITIFLQILYALAQLKITHRDLNPSNIFIKECEGKITIYLADFGFAQDTTLGKTEDIRTPLYCAPQIGKGEYYDQVDVWSLGTILYQLFSGKDMAKPNWKLKQHLQFPFDQNIDPTDQQQIKQYQKSIKQGITFLSKKIPRFIRILIRSMLEENPKKRRTKIQVFQFLDGNFSELLMHFDQIIKQKIIKQFKNYYQIQQSVQQQKEQIRRKVKSIQTIRKEILIYLKSQYIEISRQKEEISFFYGCLKIFFNRKKEVQPFFLESCFENKLIIENLYYLQQKIKWKIQTSDGELLNQRVENGYYQNICKNKKIAERICQKFVPPDKYQTFWNAVQKYL